MVMSGCRLFVFMGSAVLLVLRLVVLSCGVVLAQNCHHFGFLTIFCFCSMLLNPVLLLGEGLGSTLVEGFVGCGFVGCGCAGGVWLLVVGAVLRAGLGLTVFFTGGEVAVVLFGVIG